MRLRERVPSCRIISGASLAGYALRFHKRGIDGSGKCSVVQTNADDSVEGVVYRIDAAERRLLDAAEGLGNGYLDAELDVTCVGKHIDVFTYIAQRGYIDDTLTPYDWYKALVVTGARIHSLPADHIERLEAQQSMRDDNVQRARAHMRIVNAPFELSDFAGVAPREKRLTKQH